MCARTSRPGKGYLTTRDSDYYCPLNRLLGAACIAPSADNASHEEKSLKDFEQEIAVVFVNLLHLPVQFME